MPRYSCSDCGFIVKSEWPNDELVCPNCGGNMVNEESPPEGFESLQKFYEETRRDDAVRKRV